MLVQIPEYSAQEIKRQMEMCGLLSVYKGHKRYRREKQNGLREGRKESGNCGQGGK